MWNFRFTNLTKFIVPAVAGVESQPPSSPGLAGSKLWVCSHWAARAARAVINHISERGGEARRGRGERGDDRVTILCLAPGPGPGLVLSSVPGTQGPGPGCQLSQLPHWDNPQFVPLTDFVRNPAAGHSTLYTSPSLQRLNQTEFKERQAVSLKKCMYVFNSCIWF